MTSNVNHPASDSADFFCRIRCARKKKALEQVERAIERSMNQGWESRFVASLPKYLKNSWSKLSEKQKILSYVRHQLPENWKRKDLDSLMQELSKKNGVDWTPDASCNAVKDGDNKLAQGLVDLIPAPLTFIRAQQNLDPKYSLYCPASLLATLIKYNELVTNKKPLRKQKKEEQASQGEKKGREYKRYQARCLITAIFQVYNKRQRQVLSQRHLAIEEFARDMETLYKQKKQLINPAKITVARGF
jgi:hypothetical protein